MEEETTFPPEILNPKDVRPVHKYSVRKFIGNINIDEMSTDITKIGDETYLLKPDRFNNVFSGPVLRIEPSGFGQPIGPWWFPQPTLGQGWPCVLYKDNPTCWRKLFNIKRIPWNCLELINTDSLEVKGSANMEKFKPWHTYAVYFWIEMKEDARFETTCSFTLVVTDGKKTKLLKAQTLNLEDLTPNVLYRVPLGEFTATPTKGEVRFSLTNFDPNWKSGMIFAGVVFEHARLNYYT